VKITLEGAQAKVIVDGKISTPFVISIGVRQGDVSSATLFNFVLHKSLKNLEKSNTILNRLTQICGYADDILVIARSLPALEALCVKQRKRQSGPDSKPRQDQVCEIFSVPIPEISERGNHKWCNL
jgi:hypothetical protein